MTSVEVMNESRRRKRINKAAQQLASAAAEAAAPSKKIRLTEGEDGVMKVGGGSDGEDDSSDDANADIIMSMTKEERAIRAKAAKKASSSHVKDMTEKKTSTTKQKALARLRERQEREANRSVLLEELAKHSISASETAIMKSSSKLGKAKQTKKERLQQALKEERIGIKVTDSTGLVVGMDTGGMSARKARKLALEAKERELQSSGGEDEEEEEEEEEDEGEGGEDGEDGEDGEEVVVGGGGDQDMEDAGDDRDGASEEKMGGEGGEAGEGGSAEDGKSGGKHQKKSQADAGGEHKHKKTTAKEEGGGERKPAFFVRVKRHPSIQEVRSKLPMFAEEQQVMEAIKYNDVVVLCGATGSGKSTQLPQFLYEAGYGHPEGHPGMIGCTQPRRVAAITTGRRVAKEMNAPIGKEVGFQVRYEKRVGRETRIKFMTDGILLKELQSDFLLGDYSAIIVDEAHERGLNSDVLIGMLSRVVPMRRKGARGKDGKILPPLKLIIMSATLRVSDFAENELLFPSPPPVVDVPARQHPVTIHFNRRTPVFEYMQEAFKKVVKIHKRLPGGGILIFLTGRREIDWMCRQLKQELNPRKKGEKKPRHKGIGKALPPVGEETEKEKGGVEKEGEEEQGEESLNKEGFLFGQDDGADSDGSGEEGVGDEEEGEEGGEEEGEEEEGEEESDVEDVDEEEYDLSESEGDEEEGGEEEDEEDGEADESKRIITLGANELLGRLGAEGGTLTGAESSGVAAAGGEEKKKKEKKVYVKRKPKKIEVLPLYSMLPGSAQLKVFQRVPKGTRLIVVATNVAETSITIPGIKYVVDTGRVKRKEHDPRSGIGSFKVDWTSQASANQRAGRAGRTSPGHCYRLFSSAVYEHQFNKFTEPEIVTAPIEGMILQMKAMCIPDVRTFPYPTPPEEDDVEVAIQTLVRLGALSDDGSEEITPLGRSLAKFPISPRFAKMLVLGHQGGCLPYAVALVAALSVENPIVFDRADTGTIGGEDAEEDEDKEKGGEEEEEQEGKGKGKEEEEEEGEEGGKGGKLKLVCRRDLWYHPQSDLLGVLKALGAYEFGGRDDEHAASIGLQPKHMREMSNLRGQLGGLIKLYYPSLAKHVGDSIGPGALAKPPTQKQEMLLRQIALSGLADRVARKDLSWKGKFPAYQCISTDEMVFLHAHSCLKAEAPDWVCFLELSETKKVYMKGVSAVSPSWLFKIAPSMCSRYDPLPDPPPRYDDKADEVQAVVAPLYGPRNWDLPPQTVPLPPGPELYKQFARLLLEGKVLPGFKAFLPWLSDRPALLTRSWSQQKAAVLLNALTAARCFTRRTLFAEWGKNKSFLLPEFALWVRKEHHKNLKLAWPPLGGAEPKGTGKGKGSSSRMEVGEEDESEKEGFASGTDDESSGGE